MKAKLINKKYKLYKSQIEALVKKIQIPANDLDLSDISKDLSDLYDSLNSPFMFVVIGEVKSGKSSFVNSLTGENICDVDADICTDRIQQIVYSELPFIEHKEKFFDIKGVNANILKEISIIDTPGTDSIITEHEEITRRFAPNSNLIFFVFPMINPHHSSSWEMLKIMKDLWSRNIVFIAAQADRCTKNEIEINRKKIEHYATERGINDPVIFITSSKMEQEGDTLNSGYKEIRDFINNTTSGGHHMIMKLNDRVQIANIISDKIDKEISMRKSTLNSDIQLCANIYSKYESGKDNSIKDLERILSRMTLIFKRKSGEFTDKLEESLSTGNILKQAIPLFRKNKIDRIFFENLIDDMKNSLEKSLSIEATENAAYFIDGIKYRFSEIIREVDKARKMQSADNGKRILNKFSSKREEILSDLLKGLTEIAEDRALVPTLEKHNPDIGDTVLKGGAIAAAGAILSIIAYNAFNAVFIATGGILLSALGILSAGGIILFKRNRLINEFRKYINESNNKFHKEFKNRFEGRLDLIFGDIQRLFENIDKYISVETDKISRADEVFSKQQKELIKIGEEIKKI